MVLTSDLPRYWAARNTCPKCTYRWTNDLSSQVTARYSHKGQAYFVYFLSGYEPEEGGLLLDQQRTAKLWVVSILSPHPPHLPLLHPWSSSFLDHPDILTIFTPWQYSLSDHLNSQSSSLDHPPSLTILLSWSSSWSHTFLPWPCSPQVCVPSLPTWDRAGRAGGCHGKVAQFTLAHSEEHRLTYSGVNHTTHIVGHYSGICWEESFCSYHA